jgi:hypothetical protein
MPTLMRTGGCLRSVPSKGDSWGSPISDKDTLDKDKGCLGTHPSKGHSGGSPISDRDGPLIRTGDTLEPTLQKGIQGEVRSRTGTHPLMGTGDA